MGKVKPSGKSISRGTSALKGPAGRGGHFPVRVQAKDRPNEDINLSRIASMQYPHDLPKYYMNIQISDYKRNDFINYRDKPGVVLGEIDFGGDPTLSAGPREILFLPKSSISIHLPQQLIDQHKVTYAEEPMGMIKGALTGDYVPGWVDSLFGGIGLKFGDLLGAGVFLQSQWGQAPNEFLTVLLKGPSYKQYEMTWRLSPRTKEESETIRKIIATLNQNMAPKPMGAIWGYPSVFQLAIVPNEHMMFRFKPAVLENFRINYTPNGLPVFMKETGAPESVEITAMFHELEFWFPQDFFP